ncbi:MAG: 30S ribosomal protein S8, partial [Minisyncoccales bacterium]
RIPYSNFKFEIAKVLENQGYISKIRKKGKKSRKYIELSLKYHEDNTPFILEIKRMSKPGRRMYAKGNNINLVKNGFGISIISTSQGVMTAEKAKKKNIGGELICKVW